ncbi:G patch domain-containing protein 3 [Hydra vulgaris]|uniref:G patch domain-containing protein 3 n=1 Tax=Hydra vulgaris TaxID=6087 RepID=UPI001F5E8131|nr:G patch domain-containing protein 3 [Hydra vulgaris]
MTLCDIDFLRKKDTDQPASADQDLQPFEYLYIGNIPYQYKSCALRFHFSSFIESSAFSCFHYRHRPEIVNIKNLTNRNTIEKNTANVNNDLFVTEELLTDEKHLLNENKGNKILTDEKHLPNENKGNKILTDEKHLPNENKGNKISTCCCIIKIYSAFVDKFITKYHGRLWKKFELEHSLRCIVKRMKVCRGPLDSNQMFKSKSELKLQLHYEDQTIYENDLKTLIEFNPPTDFMPYGNVGTPTKYFHHLIRQCKLPCNVIKSLGIVLPKSYKEKIYSRVEIDYDEYFKKRNFCSNIKHKTEFYSAKDSDNSDSKGSEHTNKDISNGITNKNFKSAENSDTVNEEDDAEDWERFEALYDDIDNQARPKEKLFEEDLEVKWEKGGSGLVFYTDSYFWNEMKGKDFDEDTVDDWDVDYSVYYEDGAGDKPALDQLQMRIESRRRAGKDVGPIKYSEIKKQEQLNHKKMNSFAEFEKHSKGIGTKYLKQRGWKIGSGIGASFQGITEPIAPSGQSAREHIGLGYYGEKLDRSVNLKRKAERDVYISTIYDQKDRENLNAMRFEGNELLKYRTPPIHFEKEKKMIKK